MIFDRFIHRHMGWNLEDQKSGKLISTTVGAWKMRQRRLASKLSATARLMMLSLRLLSCQWSASRSDWSLSVDVCGMRESDWLNVNVAPSIPIDPTFNPPCNVIGCAGHHIIRSSNFFRRSCLAAGTCCVPRLLLP